MVVDTRMKEKEGQAKNLLMRAWRERWTDVQWGIHVRSLVDSPTFDGSFIANCILQQALGGPGPNSLVLSYLMHSIYAEVISSEAVIRSVCKYDGFHKPYCVVSLLDLLDGIKDRVVLSDAEDKERSMELAESLASVTHWLLTCMYSSLEHLSDLTLGDVTVGEVEDSKIAVKCKNLLGYFLKDPFTSALICCAVLQNEEMFQNITKMAGEVAKFTDGPHHDDITVVTRLIENIGKPEIETVSKATSCLQGPLGGRTVSIVNPSTHMLIMSLTLTRNSISEVVEDFKIMKSIKSLTNIELFTDILHSTLASLIGNLERSHEKQVIGTTFLVVPQLFKSLLKAVDGTTEEFLKGLHLFLDDDSTLYVADTKMGCYTLDILLNRFQIVDLITESEREQCTKKKPQKTLPVTPTATNPDELLQIESTLSNIFIALDGVSDLAKNQDAIASVLLDIISNTLDLVLITAYCTNSLTSLSAKLLKLNEASKHVTGENGKAAATRALIFDVSFLVLCVVGQNYGAQAFPTNDENYFFLDWFNECMLENNTVKNPEVVLNRCDQNKVDMLLNQYLQGESELKTSLVFWHELCTNCVGVVRELLLAWNADVANVTEVKKILDVFRMKMCSLPICIAAWLCAHIQVVPEEQGGKAKYILNHFLTDVNGSSDEEHFQERFSVTKQVITKMISCVEPSSASSPSSASECFVETKPISELYKKCYNSVEVRGLLDMDTMISFKSLFEMSGSHYFVQGLVQEMMECNSALELAHWRDTLYGLFSMDMVECTTSLIRIVIPSLINYWDKESNFVEPQISALINLSVDCILACYYRQDITSEDKIEEEETSEPSSKRRKMDDLGPSKPTFDLNFLLGELFDEFDKILKVSCDARPHVTFILRFLEHLSIKGYNLPMLTSLPKTMITNLMTLMSDEITPQLLLSWHELTEKSGRSNCVYAICSLKEMQNITVHCSGGFN